MGGRYVGGAGRRGGLFSAGWCVQNHLSVDSLPPVIRVILLVWRTGTPLQREIYVLLLGRRGRGKRVLPLSAASQDNPYADTIFLGVVCSDPLNFLLVFLSLFLSFPPSPSWGAATGPPLISPPAGSVGPARTARPGAAGQRGTPLACSTRSSRPAPRV